MEVTAGMFFAAGFGTRMGDLTRNWPKPLIPVGQTTLLDHALDLGIAAGLSPIVVNTHYRAEMIADHVAGRGVTLVHEDDEILETGGGLRNALPHLGPGPVFTMNTDAVWRGPNPFDVLRQAWRPGMEALLLCIPVERASGHAGRGDFVHAPDGRITYGPGPVYTGAQIIAPDVLHEIPERVFSMRLAWDRMFARGTAHAVIYPGAWCDVGRPENLPLAESLL